MTINEFLEKIKNIPGDATVMSDSGWECDPTECSRVFYSQDANAIILTQEILREPYNCESGFIEL